MAQIFLGLWIFFSPFQDGDFKDGKIDGHAVFRYFNGDQREGFYRENVLDGQVRIVVGIAVVVAAAHVVDGQV